MAHDKSDSKSSLDRNEGARGSTRRRKPTAADLAVFKQRVFLQLDRTHSSARGLEDGLGLTRGSLSRIFSGRRRLRRHHLDLIAQALHVGPEDLVAGTILERLLSEEPRSAPAESRGLRGELEELRSKLEAREVELRQLRHELDEMRLAHGKLEREASRSMTRANEAESALEQSQARADQPEREVADFAPADEAESAINQLRSRVGGLEREVADAVARADEMESALEQSRTRVGGLEHEVASAVGRANEVELALEQSRTQIAGLNREVVDAVARANDLESALGLSIMRAGELERELAAAVVRTDEAESALGQTRSRVADLERNLAEVHLALQEASERASVAEAMEARLMHASRLLQEFRNYARHLEERMSQLQSQLTRTRRSGWAKGLVGVGLAVGALLFPSETPRRAGARQDRRETAPAFRPPPLGSRQPGGVAQQPTLH